VYGNESSKLGKSDLVFTAMDSSVKGGEEGNNGQLQVKSGKAYDDPRVTANLSAFLEWEASNKKACYRHGKDPLVEQISKYDLFVQQLAAISWGLASRFHVLHMTEEEGKLEKTEDAATFLRAMLVWQAEGQPETAPPRGWTIATAKYEARQQGASSVAGLQAQFTALRQEVVQLKAGGGGGSSSSSGGGGGGGVSAETFRNLQQRVGKLEEKVGALTKKKDPPGTGDDLAGVRCYECGKFGHYAHSCPEKDKSGPSTSSAAAAPGQG